VSDADWPRKLKENLEEKIRPCISCNFCWGEIYAGRKISCVHNPQLGMSSESGWTPKFASESKKVVVVGAGVAGLEAACMAAERGHKVIVFGASTEIGGKARIEGELPGRKDVLKVVEFQKSRAIASGIEFRLGRKVDTAEIKGLHPDHIVIATGASLLRPSFFDDTTAAVELRSLTVDLLQNPGRRSGVAVLYDQDHTEATYSAAELLSRIYDKVLIITPKSSIGTKVNYISLLGILRRLTKSKIEIISSSIPCGLSDGSLRLENVLNGETTSLADVACLTYSTPRSADTELRDALKREKFSIDLVGDCNAPRVMAAAVHEGYQVGLLI